MPRYIYQGQFADQSGNAVGAGTISVVLAGTSTSASIYTASSGGTAVNSVTSSDAAATKGKFSFYVDTDDYANSQKFDITLSKTDFTSQPYSDIVIFPEWDYYLNPSATDQSIDGNDGSMADLLAQIGTSTLATIICDPGTYNLGTTVNWSSYTNVTLKVRSGADFQIATGVTVTSGLRVEAGKYKWLSLTGTGEWLFGSGTVGGVKPAWYTRNITPGTTAMTTAIQSALDSIKGPPTTGWVDLAYESYAITQLTMYEGSLLKGSDWMFNNNLPFAHAGWAGVANKFGTFLISTDDSVDAIIFDSATPSFTKPKIKDLALVGPGSGSTVGVDTTISGGGINNGHKFLDNVFIGNFATGLRLNSFVTGSLDHPVVKGCTTGILWGDVAASQNMAIYDLDVQQCSTGIDFRAMGGVTFYGGLNQGNTVNGMLFKNSAVTSISNNVFIDVWFENSGTCKNINTDDSLAGAGSNPLHQTLFINCRGTSPAWTLALTANEAITRCQFINCQFAGFTLDLTLANVFSANTFIGGNFADIIGLAASANFENNWFLGLKSEATGAFVSGTADMRKNLGAIGANPTPDWLEGNMVELTFNANITIQPPDNFPDGAGITFVITQNGTNTVDFHADYNAKWTNTGNNGEVNSVTFRNLNGTIRQIGGEQGWTTFALRQIETGLTLLSVTTIALDANADTTIYTVPTGKRAILDHAHLVVGADAGTSDISIGQNGAETDFVGVTNLDNADAANDMVLLAPVPSATPATLKSYAAATVIQAQVANQAGGATNTLYLYGILY